MHDEFSWGDDHDWWQAQDEQAVREEAEFIRTILLATLIAIYKELENVNRNLQ
jgi:hypothetical protein